MAKLSKSEVGYEHPAAKSDHCGICRHFEVERPHGCEIVAGRILAEDWCERFVRKRSLYRHDRKER